MEYRFSPTKENRFQEDVIVTEPEEKIYYTQRYDFLRNYYFWIFLSIAFIFGIMVWGMVNNRLSQIHASNPLIAQFLNPSVMVVLSIIALIVIGYAGYQAAFACGTDLTRLIGNVFFILFLFAFLLWGYLLTQPGFVTQAYWTSIVLVVLAILWLLWLWKIDRLSSYLMIYVAVLFIFVAYYTYQLTKISQ